MFPPHRKRWGLHTVIIMMTKEEILNAKKLHEQLEEKATSLIYYLRGKCEDCLKYGKYSSLDRLIIYDKFIEIIYIDHGADYYKDATINAPIEAFEGGDNSYEEWADGYIAEYLKKEEEREAKKRAADEKRDREEYERLKKKFEGGGKA